MSDNTKPRTPKYRRQKARPYDRAFVELAGRRIYLGRYGTSESRQRYDQILHEWLGNGRQLRVDNDEITVVELAAAFMRHAMAYFRKPDGTPTSSLHNFRSALRPLKRLYGPTRACEFGPRGLRAVREEMIGSGWSRENVNRMVGKVRSVFKWGVSQELVPASIHSALTTLAPLRRGRTDARETESIRPVPEAHIRAIRCHVSRQARAMITLQRLIGMRPGEVVRMRACDLDIPSSGQVWTYRLSDHKTAHHGHKRLVYLGPRAQRVIRQFLSRKLTACLFSPAEAEAERLECRHAARATPLSCGNRPGTNRKRKPIRKPGERFTVDSYRRAIARACQAAGVPSWSPNRLRHNAATFLRREYGIDVAQTILGHRLGSQITEIYAESNAKKAVEVVSKVG